MGCGYPEVGSRAPIVFRQIDWNKKGSLTPLSLKGLRSGSTPRLKKENSASTNPFSFPHRQTGRIRILAGNMDICRYHRFIAMLTMGGMRLRIRVLPELPDQRTIWV